MNPADLILYSAPTALAALGESVGQKGGVINIGLEGLMLIGAFAAFVVSYSTGNPYLALGSGVLAALILGLIQCLFTIKLAVDQVVVGTAINLFAAGVSSALYRKQMGTSGQLLSLVRLPNWNGIDLGTSILVLSIPALTFLLNRTKWGLAVRAAGEYPDALAAAGISVNRVRLQACLIGAAFAGLAGAYLTVAVNASYTENVTAGRGFVAIALVTFGRWKPIWIAAVSLLIGFAESLQYRFQAMQINVPPQLLLAMPYLLALLVLAVFKGRTAAPQSLAKPYSKEAL